MMNDFLLRFFADYLFAILIITAAVVILRLRRKRGEVIARGVFAGICALIIDKSSGLFYYHDRPFVVKGTDPLAINPHNNSFPSDHALIVFTAALVVWAATKNWKWGFGLLLGGVAVGWARVIAEVHWPIDIIGSFCIALVMVAIWFAVPLPKPLRRFSRATERFIRRKLPNWLTRDKKEA